MADSPIIHLATRGSALALAQTNAVLAQCRDAFPHLRFEIKIIRTTGDKIQTASMANQYQELPKGLFTKEIEQALLANLADIAVHSLKDLPTELPSGLTLGAVTRRADARDVLIYRAAPEPGTVHLPADGTGGLQQGPGLAPNSTIHDLPPRATIATSSTRRQAQLRALRPDVNVIPIRGNVGTRLQKLRDEAGLDAIILAAAGLERLGFVLTANGELANQDASATRGGDAKSPVRLLAVKLSLDEMLPCPGQGAIGIEVRSNDPQAARICERLNHRPTMDCVTAERAFLRAMGGGCQSPLAAYAENVNATIRLRVISFQGSAVQRAEETAAMIDAAALGERLANKVRSGAGR